MPLSDLIQPTVLGPLTLPTRVAMAPMTRQYSPGNVPGPQVVDYYRRRAEGGVGLIITEGTYVGRPAAGGYANVPFFYGEEALAGWKNVVDAVHAAGGKIVPQLWHVGAIRGLAKGEGALAPDATVPAMSPSGLVRPGSELGVAMSKEEIAATVEAFAQAAEDAKRIGFDGVEIHGAHGYLIDQFFWEGTNQRTDEYGGSMENRSRFALDIIRAVRARVGEGFPIILRFSQWKQQEYTARLANTPEELQAFLQPMAEAGVDIFHCSTRRFWEPEFEGSDLNLAGWTKKLTGKPTITVGSVGLDADFIDEDARDMSEHAAPASIENLLERLEREEFDLVAVGRALIANPDWVHKVVNADADSLVPFEKKALAQLV